MKNNKIKVKLIKSPIGSKKDQIGTINALGLRKLNQIREIDNNNVMNGMLFKVKHLVKII